MYYFVLWACKYNTEMYYAYIAFICMHFLLLGFKLHRSIYTKPNQRNMSFSVVPRERVDKAKVQFVSGNVL